jgi:hypothetical protein
MMDRGKIIRIYNSEIIAVRINYKNYQFIWLECLNSKIIAKNRRIGC